MSAQLHQTLEFTLARDTLERSKSLFDFLKRVLGTVEVVFVGSGALAQTDKRYYRGVA